VLEIELPETREEITLWRLEQVDQSRSYLHWLQLQVTAWCSGLATRILVTEWLARIWPLGVVTSVYIGNSADASIYYRVSVAGIEICTVNQTHHNEIRGETRVRN
jgi:hypothetical protein